MTYARARLWLGITTVGTLVLLSLAALLLNVPERTLPRSLVSPVAELTAIMAALTAWSLVLVPFELVGGFLLPRSHGRGRDSNTRDFIRWLRAVVCHVLLVSLLLFSVMLVRRTIGWPGAVAWVFALQVLLIAAQARVAQLVGGLRRSPDSSRDPDLVVFDHADEGFTGGIVGPPGLEKIVIPDAWLTRLSEDELGVEVERRRGAIRIGSRWKGLLLATLWNTIGFGAATLLPQAGLMTVSETINSVLYFGLISFLGLLILPTFSRRAVLETDGHVLERGSSVAQLERAAVALDRLQDDEPDRSAALESIFHPQPCVRRRIDAATRRTEQRFGAWNAARMALFLSWVGGGPLARAVHCNVGRPELWVLLPN